MPVHNTARFYVFEQANAHAEFSAYVDGSLAKTFTVLAGGVKKLSDTAANFQC